MNKNKREYISDCIRLADINIVRIADIDIDEEARRMNHRKIPFGNHREFSKLDSTLREAAMALALSQDFNKLERKEIGCTSKQKEIGNKIQSILDKRNYNLHIRDIIKSFEEPKNAEIKTQDQ